LIGIRVHIAHCVLLSVSTAACYSDWSDGWSKYQKCSWSIWWSC